MTAFSLESIENPQIMIPQVLEYLYTYRTFYTPCTVTFLLQGCVEEDYGSGPKWRFLLNEYNSLLQTARLDFFKGQRPDYRIHFFIAH